MKLPERLGRFISMMSPPHRGRAGGILLIETRDEIERLNGLLTAECKQEPINMVLHCPACGVQHIDGPEDCPDEGCPHYGTPHGHPDDWANPPHRSHLCHHCGHIWRPADVATNGVAAIATKGRNDSTNTSTDPLKAERDSRSMFVTRLQYMQIHGDKWLTVVAVLALLNDCDMLAQRDAGPSGAKK